jgi:hypothetical protein
MAAALLDVAEGRVPKDRLALKCLIEEMLEWPFLGEDGAAAAAEAKASVAGGASSSSNGSSKSSKSSGEMEVVIDGGENQQIVAACESRASALPVGSYIERQCMCADDAFKVAVVLLVAGVDPPNASTAVARWPQEVVMLYCCA